jgi:hypothetical protein
MLVANSDGLESFNSSPNAALPLPSGTRTDCLDSQSLAKALGESEDRLPFGSFANDPINQSETDCENPSSGANSCLTDVPGKKNNLSDGFILWNILNHPNDSLDAKRWLSRLDEAKASIAKRLCKHETLVNVLRKVLNIPGQRQGLKLGIWLRILKARDDEVWLPACVKPPPNRY